MNAIAAAYRLANMLVFGGSRRFTSVIIFLLPVLAALVFRIYSDNTPDTDYGGLILGFYTILLIPFVGIYWGTSLLTDEIEGKTLVFLWTRPIGRMKIFLLKFVWMGFWFVVLSAVSIFLVYVCLFSRIGMDELVRNSLMVVWDVRALALGAVAYAALGFLLASFLKKPLIIGLLYSYFIDGFVMFLPGFLKRLSLRHYIYTLGTHPPEQDSGKLLKILSESTTTETQAWATLMIASVVLAVFAAFLVSKKEFSGDDPARGQ